jgi:hypothetical protein
LHDGGFCWVFEGEFGCNLEDDNPTNNPDSQYGKQVLQKLYQGGVEGNSVGAVFVHLHDGGFCWVFEGEFKGAVFDVVIGFGLEYQSQQDTCHHNTVR